VVGAIAGVMVASRFGDSSFAGNEPEGMVVAPKEKSDETNPEEACYDGMWVDIGGAVVNPGVYCVDADAVVKSVIEAGGGLHKSACSEWIDEEFNRAALVEPNSKIYIPGTEDSECSTQDVISQDAESEPIFTISLFNSFSTISSHFSLGFSAFFMK